jgi:hypothetical protein
MAASKAATPPIIIYTLPFWINCFKVNLRPIDGIVESKSFDNGVICGSENNLVVDNSVAAGLP